MRTVWATSLGLLVGIGLGGCATTPQVPEPTEPGQTSQIEAYVKQECRHSVGGPYLIFEVEPRYPREAYNLQTRGYAILKFDVTLEGRTTNIEVLRSKPDQTFATEAVNALAQWRYCPDLRRPRANLSQKVRLDFVLR